jgi:prepilin peptidase CpaA
MMTWLGLVALISVLVIAAWTDVRSRRIPNVLTLSALVAALVLAAIAGDGALLAAAKGAGLGLLVALPLLAVGGMGGGDAKLLIAVGAFTGPAGFMAALAWSGMVGVVMALWLGYRRGVLLPIIFNTRDLIRYGMSFGRSGERVTLDSAHALSIPYGVAIAAGTVVSVLTGVGP